MKARPVPLSRAEQKRARRLSVLQTVIDRNKARDDLQAATIAVQDIARDIAVEFDSAKRQVLHVRAGYLRKTAKAAQAAVDREEAKG